MLGDEWFDLTHDPDPMAIIRDPIKLYEQFGQWIQSVSDEPYWSRDASTSQRIHWTSLFQAANHVSKMPSLSLPGCYMFAWGTDSQNVVPRYVGQTGGQSLERRLHGRYIRRYAEKFQSPHHPRFYECNYAAWLSKNGLADTEDAWRTLPSEFDEVLYKHFKAHGRKPAKDIIAEGLSISEAVARIKEECEPALTIKNGEDFAKHGIDNIWLAVFPVSDRSRAGQLEEVLIPVVDFWNQKNGREMLLNRQQKGMLHRFALQRHFG